MKQALQNKLFEAFPKLFAQKDEDKKVTCMCWGIECPDAWYDAIYAACALLQTMTDNNTHSDKYPQVQFTQVKEKFGALCMYNNVNTDYVNGVIDMADAMVQQLDKKNKVKPLNNTTPMDVMGKFYEDTSKNIGN